MIQYTTGQRREIIAVQTLIENTPLRDLFDHRPGFHREQLGGVLTIRIEDAARLTVSTGENVLLDVLGSLVGRRRIYLSDVIAHVDATCSAAVVYAIAVLAGATAAPEVLA
ncbi:MAG TPA: hypothetical protein VJL80_09885 [Aeromicrobium sp.]|nr:hypothetical protein [Aeromicrobium sp.]HKY58336.1 hypothetical protein [Aeromicrobium sp.]